MYQYYILASIPILLGLIFSIFNKKINLREWAIGSAIAFITAGILHLMTIRGITSDTEIWSGKIVEATRYPEWVEEYQEAIYRTEHKTRPKYSNEKLTMESYTERIFSHYETRHRTHSEYCTAIAFFGSESKEYRINTPLFNSFASQFGYINTNRPSKSGFDGGDPNVYVTSNSRTNLVIPVTTVKSWANKVKAAPSTFSFQKVDPSVPVFNYPSCGNMWRSDRLLGDAQSKMSIESFDQMNSRLGINKKCNVIVIGFNTASSSISRQQRDAWLGGKKNDIVICYGFAPLEGGINVVVWTYVFSWSENEEVNRNLEKIFLDFPINDAIIPQMEREIMKSYVKKDWSKMDYIKVKPTNGWYIAFIITQLIVQGVLYFIFYVNYWEDDVNRPQRVSLR